MRPTPRGVSEAGKNNECRKQMNDAHFGQSNIEVDDGLPPTARVATRIEAHQLRDARRSDRLRHGALKLAAVVALTAGLGVGLFALEGVRR
jgi:hypothetical protein